MALGQDVNVNANLSVEGLHEMVLAGVVAGAGTLTKNGHAELTLVGNNTFSGTWDVRAGSLTAIASGALGSNAGVDLGSSGTLKLSASNGLASLSGSGTAVIGAGTTLGIGGGGSNASSTFAGTLSGAGSLTKQGAGTLTLSGTSDLTGATNVNAGTLIVNGALASATVNVASGATLGGSGSLTGAVTVASGATLAPGASTGNGPVTGSLTVVSLTMNQGSTLAPALGAPGANFQTLGQGSSVTVTGNLDLNGAVLDVRNTGSFGPGLYRLFDYGTLTNNSLTTSTAGISLQHLTGARQINLINTQGMALNFWNANGLASSTAQGGGTGTWSSTAPLWTDATGALTATMSPQPGFAIFGGAAGTVTVDENAATVQATGLQFASDGYQLTGDALTLAADVSHVAPVEIRVGDGSAASSAWTATLNNVIAGSDGLKKTGAGTLVLAGANSYTGGTTVAEGTLSVGQDSNLGAAGADVTLNGGTLQITGTGFANSSTRHWQLGNAGGGIDIAVAGHSFTLGSALVGTGSLTKTGAGTLVLTGANSYIGGTTIGGGTLALGAGGSLPATGAVALTGSGATFDISGANSAQTIASLQGVAGSRVLLGNQKLTLWDAAPTTSSTFDGSLSGTASARLDKQGSGTLTLAGDSSAFAGSTTIHDGTLALAAAQLGGALTLASGAMLTGTGTVGTLGTGTPGNANTLTRVQNGATVAPGNATNTYGTLQVAGDLAFEAGSIYRVQVDPASNASSRIDVGGSATLAGGVLHVGKQSNAGTDFQVGKSYTILTAASLQGAFDTVASNYAYLAPTLSYSTSDVTLRLERKTTGGGNTGGGNTGGGTIGFADLAESSNQAGVANGIESLGSGALYNHVLHLPNGAPAAFFSQVSGDTHATVAGSLNTMSALTPGITTTHLRANLTAGMYPGAPVAQSDGPLPASAWPSSKALPAWAEVVGHWQTFDGNGNAAQLKQRTTGIFLGMDQEVGTSGWRLGGSVGYTNADGKVADRASESDVNSYSAAVYGGKSFGTGTGPRINVLGGLAYTWHDIATTRKVESLGQTLKADYSAHTAQLFAEVGYAIGQYDAVGVEPFLGVNVGTQRTRGFQEHGGFAALQGASSTDDLASTTLGVRVHSDFQLAGKEGRLRATVGWRHALGDVAQSKTMAFEGGQNFTVAGSPLARNTALLGLEADVALSRSAALVLGYQGELGSGQRDHSANVKLRWAF